MAPISSYRCSSCDANWPCVSHYEKCPLCGTATWASGMQPLKVPEARQLVDTHNAKLALHEKFERFYEEREVKLLREELDSLLC